MSSLFYGYHQENNINPNENFIYRTNERQGIYSLPFLFEKYLDNDYSRMFAKAKINQNISYMQKGFYPNSLMMDVERTNCHYNKLNQMFKLE